MSLDWVPVLACLVVVLVVLGPVVLWLRRQERREPLGVAAVESVPARAVVTIAVPNDALLARARTLVAWAEADVPGADGENKRHRVYGRLIKAFPDRSRRDLSRAIEAALED